MIYDTSLADMWPLTEEAYQKQAEYWDRVGFDLDAHPIEVWRDPHGVVRVIDGRTRLRYARDRIMAIYTDRHLRWLKFASEDEARAYVFDLQVTRRNLSPAQVAVVAMRAGRDRPQLCTPLAWGHIARMKDHAPHRLDWILGRATRTVQAAWNDAVRAGEIPGETPPKRRDRPARDTSKSPPRGPAPNVPEGHEVHGVSTLTGPDGETRGQWTKTSRTSADEPPVPIPEAHHIKRTTVMLGADGGTRIQHVQYAPDEVARERAMLDAWARHAELYAGLATPTPAPVDVDGETCTLYPLGDPHIGMLAWAPETGDHFDLKIACRELLACVRLMVSQAPASALAIVTNLGDFMHAQDDNALTPGHKNKLDVDGRYSKSLDAGHVLLRGIVDAALERHARVRVRNLPGNHDPRVAAELMMWLRAVYEREPRVEIADAFAAHQYDAFGVNLFGWHHGDGTKPAELPALMATDEPELWGAATERVWHTGHVHHRQVFELKAKENPGCIVESHRTMAGRDSWHARRYRAGRSLSAITYHEKYGEIARATVNLRRVRAAIAQAAEGT